MNAHIIKTISSSFIAREKEKVMGNARDYTADTLQQIKSSAIYRVFGNCIILLEQYYGNPGLLGLITIVTLLKNWQQRSDASWLENQLKQMENADNEAVGQYVISFLSCPDDQIPEVEELLLKNPELKNFIAFCEKRNPKFRIGAFFLIGLLLYVDREKNEGDILVIQE